MITLKDIAKRAGVNVSTVSRALNDSSEVSSEKKEEIKIIAEELGYIPNEFAAVLAGKNAKTIGILLPEISSNYYARVAGVVEAKLKKKGYSLIIGQSNFNPDNELDYIKLFIKKKVNGIIAASIRNPGFSDEIKKWIGTSDIPFVHIESYLNISEYDNVEIDNRYGIKLAVKHLAELGHKRIGFISEKLSESIRYPAFKAALQEFEIPLHERMIKSGAERFEEGGYLRMLELLNQDNPPTAVFASYDSMALGAMQAARERGLEIPKDISIVGYDNVRESAYYPAPLTTVAPPVIEMGELAVDLLTRKIEKKEKKLVQHVSLKPKLIIRKSSSPVNN